MKTGTFSFVAIAMVLALLICIVKRTNPAYGSAPGKTAGSIYHVYQTSTDDPKLIWSSDTPSSSDSAPAIFYSPHQDDETIGMGASIAEQVRLGRPVYIVLLTSGENLNMLKFLQSTYPASSMQDVVDARNREFIAACKALGAERIYIANGGKGFDEKQSLPELVIHFKKTISYFAVLHAKASHITVSGNCDSYNDQCEKMPSHQAAATAIHEEYNAGKISGCILYRVYFYYRNSNRCDRLCNWVKPVFSADKVKRQHAINEYKYVSEKEGRYGLGYWHSVDVLFNNSWDSNYEQVDSMKNDY